jgi:hypothetical protein
MLAATPISPEKISKPRIPDIEPIRIQKMNAVENISLLTEIGRGGPAVDEKHFGPFMPTSPTSPSDLVDKEDLRRLHRMGLGQLIFASYGLEKS